MGSRGEATRERVLSVAEDLVLKRGFAGTSIDDIVKGAGITKGGFFYHFDGKDDLAVGLMRRYQVNDASFFQALGKRAADLTEDPLQQMLIFLKLLAEAMGDLPSVHPGCLVATFTYESQQVNDDVRAINEECVLHWRRMFLAQLARIERAYEAVTEVGRDQLADMLSSIIEGGIVVSKALNDQDILVQQILQYRNYLRLLYRPKPEAEDDTW